MSFEQFSQERFCPDQSGLSPEHDAAPGPDFSAYIGAQDRPEPAYNSDLQQQDFQRAFENLGRQNKLSERVRYISNMMIDGEPHDPGKFAFPSNANLSETFMSLRSSGFSNREIVDKVNQHLTNGKSPLRLNLVEDGEIAKLDVVNREGRKLISGDRVVTTYDADIKERDRVKQIAERCATSLNNGNLPVEEFQKMVEDATKNGTSYFDFVSRLSQILDQKQGGFKIALTASDGRFLLKHSEPDKQRWYPELR